MHSPNMTAHVEHATKQLQMMLATLRTPSTLCRLKEQRLQEAQDSMGVSDRNRQAAERATETACQAKRRMENETARLQRLVAELEHSKRYTLLKLQLGALYRVNCKAMTLLLNNSTLDTSIATKRHQRW